MVRDRLFLMSVAVEDADLDLKNVLSVPKRELEHESHGWFVGGEHSYDWLVKHEVVRDWIGSYTAKSTRQQKLSRQAE